MNLILTKNDIGKLEEIISDQLLDSGAEHVVLADLSGNLIMECGSLEMEDVFSLAAVSAANFAATSEIARLIGEQDFALMYHKGGKRNVHFSRLAKDYLIITLFNDNVSLGLIRLKLGSAINEMRAIFGGDQGKSPWRS
ncbi:MAG: roadblock/LC7 domain-containing protein [Syntrophobacteraceae bacterium]|jgi:predicted regulator of Ras-like GTPase activity (Roadblock/LC7/MglB family)